MKNISLVADKKEDIIKYLCNNTDYSKNKIKSLFKYKKIYVNNKIVNKLPYILNINDSITIDLEVKEELPFEIIYEDNEIIVVKKENGLLTIGTLGENEKTLYHMVREYANKNKTKLFIINRLDKETSGIVMFAKNERIKALYQDNWNELVTKRGYIAIVDGIVKKDGRIENLLYEEKNTFVHSSKIGKKAITNYKVIKTNDKYSLLDINIETGRKNQIRVHLSELGYPILGDKKYGCKIDPLNRMCLHNYELNVKHPITNKELHFEYEYPKYFHKII